MADRSLYDYRLRPHQARVLDFAGGRLAVSAVPGSGKTLTLALLAAELIVGGHVGDEGEVLVVTVQNSAVDNISQRIRRILVEQKLPPVGYRVCTLHKLAADILRQRHDLAGVEEGFLIVDGSESQRLMYQAAKTWIAAHQSWWRSFLPEATEGKRANLEKAWLEQTQSVGREVAKLCKHLRLLPEQARRLVDGSGSSQAFLAMGVDLYSQYERYLRARCGLDFDDLIWRAIDALEQDETFLRHLRERWPYVLEDEAQDSSPLQEHILERLAGERGNWVRVGDPNQSINSTFTAADPRYFRRFMQREGVQRLLLLESGRCARPIIDLANHLVRWTCDEHPEAAVREMAFELQGIRPTALDDPQANPPDEECRIHFRDRPFADVASQAAEVARWAGSYVRRRPKRTVAILCPARWQGNEVVEVLEGMSPPVPYDDLLRSTPRTRSIAKALATACQYLGRPTSSTSLSRLHGVLSEAGCLGESAPRQSIRRQQTLLRSLATHDLLFPRTTARLSELLPPPVEVFPEDVLAIERFATLVSRWVRASSLPVDQLILTIAQDLFEAEVDLAICHTVASSLRATSQMHPNWRLPDFAADLDEVARNRRALGRLSLADVGYTAQPGRVVITTMHKAKGLEWDAVFLICVDSLEYPDTCADAFRDELYFMPGHAPAVEARKCLERLAGADFATTSDRTPVELARLEYIAERLRLLYVGITRARRHLAFTWSKTNGHRRVRPATALLELSRADPTATPGGEP